MENCNNHDHYNGECLEIDWIGAVEEREGYERQEVLTQQQIDLKQEETKKYISNINKQNRAKVMANNPAPF